MTELTILPELRDLIPPLTEEEYLQLEANCLANGIREPISVWADPDSGQPVVIDGHNRYGIAKANGLPFETRLYGLSDLEAVKLWMIENQFGRRNISDFVRYELAAKKADILRAKGRARQGTRTDLLSTVDKKLPAHNTRNEVAADLGWSTGKVGMAKVVSMQATEETKVLLRKNEITINAAYKDIKRQAPTKEARPAVKPTIDPDKIPGAPFDIIYADPPWQYDFSKSQNRKIENHYPTMTLEEICAMKVPAKEDAVLYLWATAPKLPEAMAVIEAWDFKYKTCAVWDKETVGMGYWFRGQHELLLVATRGKVSPPPVEGRRSSVVRYKRERHSAKPEPFYHYINMAFPYKTKVELFARRTFPGWASWGNQL